MLNDVYSSFSSCIGTTRRFENVVASFAIIRFPLMLTKNKE
jgi:hypothetical protein